MLSYTCETAVKAVIFLATQSGNTGIKEIAKNLQASEHTVGKMLQTLVKQGVISSLKGPSGGFFLSQDQKIQPLIHIVEAIDGKKVFSRCGLGLSRCSETHPCPIHNEYKKPRDIMEKIFKTKKVQDLCEPVNNGFAYLFG
jgi:Rrf2 family protein